MKLLPLPLRLLKTSATVLFWLTLVGFGGVAFFMFQSTRFDEHFSYTFSLTDIRLNPPAKVVTEPGRQLAFGADAPIRVSFNYTDPMRFRKDLGQHAGLIVLPMILTFALLLVGLWQVKCLFDTLGTPHVFSAANVRRIRLIACLLIAYQLLPTVVSLFVQADMTELLSKHNINYTVNRDFKFFDIVITAILLFGLAEVFHYGLQLKQEQDLTI